MSACGNGDGGNHRGRIAAGDGKRPRRRPERGCTDRDRAGSAVPPTTETGFRLKPTGTGGVATRNCQAHWTSRRRGFQSTPEFGLTTVTTGMARRRQIGRRHDRLQAPRLDRRLVSAAPFQLTTEPLKKPAIDTRMVACFPSQGAMRRRADLADLQVEVVTARRCILHGHGDRRAAHLRGQRLAAPDLRRGGRVRGAAAGGGIDHVMVAVPAWATSAAGMTASRMAADL